MGRLIDVTEFVKMQRKYYKRGLEMAESRLPTSTPRRQEFVDESADSVRHDAAWWRSDPMSMGFDGPYGDYACQAYCDGMGPCGH